MPAEAGVLSFGDGRHLLASDGHGYVYLTDISNARPVDYTEPLIVDLPHGSRRLINLDFDADGRLVGIEVEGAGERPPP